jgi:outer membrane cobalamin receptor
MKKIALMALVLICQAAVGQNKNTLSGFIKDKRNGEALIGATVYLDELKTGASTNVYGYFAISAPPGSYTAVFSFVGYRSQALKVALSTDQKITVELDEEGSVLQDVVITAEREDANVKSIEMSVAKLDIKTISKIPPLLGEVDVVRSVQLLPGVSTVGEGASGFNVRGGSIDHNLILLDEAPVYNSSHLFGFFSVFNPDAVKDVKLIKGGVPAQYGGRLASLLDIRMKEGNSKKYEVNGGIGLLSSRLAVEGPLIRDKSSFIVAGRRTYFDLFLPLSPDENIRDSKAFFYDLTAKVNYKINDKNTLYLSGYFGRDKFGFGENFGFEWGNTTATLRWNNVISPRLFANYTAFYSNYDYALNIQAGKDAFRWRSNIINYSIKPEFTYFLNDKNTITFGGQSLYYDLLPGRTTVTSQGNDVVNTLPKKFALENGLYIANEQTLNSRLSVQYGLRYSNFAYLGSGSTLMLGDTTPGVKRPIRSIESYSANEQIASYGNLEPRFALKYELNTNSSIKASYNRMAQYLHLLSNTQASVPLDVWTPSTNNIKPQLADQVALGYFINFGEQGMYEASAEVYYKDMQNQIDYIDGADLLLNRELEAELLTGKGRAYGLELFVKKRRGTLNGWVSYTLARTERQVEGINRGTWYPARFDRLHNLYVVGIWEYSKRLSFSANFVYGSGTPGTFPTNRFDFQGIVVPHNADEQRNNLRIPAYHRLDLSATLEGKRNSERRWQGSWTFALYNVYARRNPFGIFFRQTLPPEGERVAQATNTEAIRFAVLGTIVPSVTYNFKF